MKKATAQEKLGPSKQDQLAKKHVNMLLAELLKFNPNIFLDHKTEEFYEQSTKKSFF